MFELEKRLQINFNPKIDSKLFYHIAEPEDVTGQLYESQIQDTGTSEQGAKN